MKNIHIIGIGGSGMSAIAKVLYEKGYHITGSNNVMTEYISDLQNIGIIVYIGHDKKYIQNIDTVLISSAIPKDNVELIEAISQNIPIFKRNDFLKFIIEGQRCIAISGTHGKTTTTSMISWVLSYAGLDPSYIIGGVSKNLGNNAKFGLGDYFVIEADEYDRMFLGLNPYIAVITNIEHDHPDYYIDLDSIKVAFRQFIQNITTDGTLIACNDDVQVRDMLKDIKDMHNCITYGLKENAKYNASNIYTNDFGGTSFDVQDRYFDLKVNGYHNVSNALSCIAVADLLNINEDKIYEALYLFESSCRRFEIKYDKDGLIWIDDYAHHPTEIKATLNDARLRYSDKKIWAIWQPHTFSRTRLLWDDFVHSFDDADNVIVLPIYRSRESSIDFPDVDITQMPSDISADKAIYIDSFDKIVHHIKNNLSHNDVCIVLSAGDANKIIDIFNG